MPINFPADCITNDDRIEYCYIAQEEARKLHNLLGQWSLGLLPLGQYQQLPPWIQNKYEWADKLSSQDWEDFKVNIHKVIMSQILPELLIYRPLSVLSADAEIRSENRPIWAESSRWTVDLQESAGP